jgi:hypothetical protein
MADITIKYNSKPIGEMSESGTAKLLIEGKKCTGDIEISYTKSSCDASAVRGFVAVEKDSNGNITKGAMINTPIIGEVSLVLPTRELSHMTELECDNLGYIAEYGLAGLPALKSFIIPANCDMVGEEVFCGDTSLESITFLGRPSSIANRAFLEIPNLKDIYVPWGSGEIPGAPWGATSATIHYGEGIGVEISDTWAQIIAATQDGTYKTKYHIHDYKTIDMGSEGIIEYEIVGIDKDVKANGDTVPLSFLAKSALATKHQIDTQAPSGGGYPASEMKTYLNETVKSKLPKEIQDNLTSVVKYSIGFTNRVYAEMESIETIWIPSGHEILGGYESTGPVYSPSTKIKQIASSSDPTTSAPTIWWLRSANGNSIFRGIEEDGTVTKRSYHELFGVVPGFCLG